KRIRELGLDHMEIEWVHGVRLKEDKASEIRKVAEDNDVSLTVHGPYYVNLNANDPKKRAASRQRIVDSCVLGQIAGAKSVCFHAAFYLGQTKEQVFDQVLSEMMKIEEEVKKRGADKIWISPELTGKPSQFGDLQEILALAKNLDQTRICLDFAHFFARYAGAKYNYQEFKDVLLEIKKELGKELLENLHIHYSGIEYSGKGERRHLDLDKSNFNYKAMLKALKDEKVGGYMVCEGPNLEIDALKAKEYYEKL
ncbi:TIM barrel protein, partial [Patescibacteria group bacterium]|nr:TIM barrel protein [Patescibacteria group bacterium]